MDSVVVELILWVGVGGGVRASELDVLVEEVGVLVVAKELVVLSVVDGSVLVIVAVEFAEPPKKVWVVVTTWAGVIGSEGNVLKATASRRISVTCDRFNP